MKHVWLCGASEKVSFEEGNNWRKGCVEWFENNSDHFRAWNPNDYYNYNEQLHHTDGEIIGFCHNKVDQADVILVNLKDIRKSVGSISELAWAHFMRKPVVGFLESDDHEDFYKHKDVEELLKSEIHPWIYGFCWRIQVGKNAIEDALCYIERYFGE